MQFSATSQTPAAARQVFALERKPSAGQLLPMPSQVSGLSQTPAALRQTAELLASAGQAAAEPVQFSTGSQTPAEPRHWVDELTKPSAGQFASGQPSMLPSSSAS